MVLHCEWFSLGNGCGNHKCRRDYWFADAKRLGRPWLPPCLASAKGEDWGGEEQTEGKSGKVWTEENWKRNFVRLWMAGDVSVLFEMEENTEGGWDNANRWKQEATKRTQAMWRKDNNMWETVPTLKHDMCHYELMRRRALCHFTAGGFSWNWNPSLWAWVLLSGRTRCLGVDYCQGGLGVEDYCQGGLGVHRIPGGRWDLPPPKPPLSHLGKSIVNSDHVWEISIAVVERFAYILHFENGRLIVHSDHVWGRRAKWKKIALQLKYGGFFFETGEN